MAKKQTKEQRIKRDQLRLQKIYEGDDKEFSQVYSECQFLVKLYKSKYRGNTKVNVEDAFTEAAYTCYANIKSGKLRLLSGELKDYISRVMHFKLYDENKKYASEVEIEQIEYHYDISDNDKVLIKKRFLVSQFVDSMEEPCKTIIELFYLENNSYKEILNKVKGITTLDSLKSKSYKCKIKMEAGLRKLFEKNEIKI